MRSLISLAAASAVALLAGFTASDHQQPTVPSAAQQLASAVLPLPAALRQGVTVHGYAPDGKFVTLQKGDGPMICLASDPKTPNRFHVACYHRDLEPFMARGRALRAEGVTGERVDTVRFAEIAKGTLDLPRRPMSLYSITAPAFDYATNTPTAPRPLFVVYIPFATAASTGLSTTPSAKEPWLMLPGTPKAHLMITGSM